jgi:hypothetical protein
MVFDDDHRASADHAKKKHVCVFVLGRFRFRHFVCFANKELQKESIAPRPCDNEFFPDVCGLRRAQENVPPTLVLHDESLELPERLANVFEQSDRRV